MAFNESIRAVQPSPDDACCRHCQLHHADINSVFAGGGGGPGGGGGGSFVHYDALEISRNAGHEGHGNAEVSFVAADFSSLHTFIHERATLKSSQQIVKASPRRQLSWPG